MRKAGAPFMGMQPLRCAYERVPGARHPASGSHPRAYARGTCSAVRGRTSLWFAPCLKRIPPLLFDLTFFLTSNINADNSEALH